MTDPKLGDLVTVRVPAAEREIKDLWWWDGAKGMIADVWEGRRVFLVATPDGYTGWFDRRLLVLVNDDQAPAAAN